MCQWLWREAQSRSVWVGLEKGQGDRLELRWKGYGSHLEGMVETASVS